MLVGTLSGVCRRWYPIVQELHRFFMAVSRTVVNNDGSGGTDPDPPSLVRGCPSQEAEDCGCCSQVCLAGWSSSHLGFQVDNGSPYCS